MLNKCMRKLIIISLILLTSGCASITGIVPSFWDDNQSSKIVDARLSIERIDCASEGVRTQVSAVRDQLLWFELYSESKGRRQQDVVRLVHPIRETVEDMHKRLAEGTASRAYCEIKVRILKSQTQTASQAILGRF